MKPDSNAVSFPNHESAHAPDSAASLPDPPRVIICADDYREARLLANIQEAELHCALVYDGFVEGTPADEVTQYRFRIYPTPAKTPRRGRTKRSRGSGINKQA